MEKKTNTKKTAEKIAPTRAEKKDAAKKLILDLLKKTSYKASDLIDTAAKLYAEKFGGEDNENPNDVKGRIGSILDVMKKEGEVAFEGGVYASKEEKLKKSTRKTTKKTTVETKDTEKTQEKPEEKKKTVKTKRASKKQNTDEPKEEQTEEKTEEKTQPLPPAPTQPIAPVAPVTPEVAPEPIPEDKPKKRTRKAKKEETKQEPKQEQLTPVSEIARSVEVVEVAKVVEVAETIPQPQKQEEKKEEKQAESPKGTLMDMSFLFGDVKPVKRDEVKKQELKKEQPQPQKQPQAEQSPVPAPAPVQKKEEKEEKGQKQPQKRVEPKKLERPLAKKRALTADEKLQEAYLKKLHRLGGDYFEYYSVYLLERYSRKNGRRLESLKISGGDHDGGIDGEIELTDRLGFRETIYIQSKNWDPDKGDEKLWVVGETLVQQFIGACVCRQAKEGKQNCRGIFITTSRFTPEAKRLLNDVSDKFVGYDGDDLFETAKECAFGIVKKNGEWVLDEELLAGEKAFFKMF